MSKLGRITEGISYFNTKTKDNYAAPIIDQMYCNIIITPDMKAARRKYLKSLRDEAKYDERNNTGRIDNIPY